MRYSKLHLLLSVGAMAAGACIILLHPPVFSLIPSSNRQFLIAPFVLGGLAFITHRCKAMRFLPLVALSFTLLLWALSACYAFGPTLTLLPGDSTGAETKKFADKLNATGKRFGAARLTPRWSNAEADRFPYVSLDTHYLSVANLPKENPFVSKIVSPQWNTKLSFTLVSELQSTLVPLVPHQDSARFMAAILNPTVENLNFASDLRAPWRSSAHLAYAGLLYGNRLTEEALASDHYSVGEFDCARDAYTRALSNLLPSDNSALKSALLSNQAILLFLRGKFENSKSLRYESIRWIDRALKLAGQRRDNTLIGFLKKNRNQIIGYLHEHKKK